MGEIVQLPDSVVFIVASAIAIVGLALLFIVAPSTDEQRYILRGTVLERHGRAATVAANVTVVGKNLSGSIEREVFWNGKEFIALNQAAE